MAIIEVEHLTKDYGAGRGVFDVSFSVMPGEVYGFLGPNGAGKTTTIRHLMGFSRPDSGKCSVFGMESFGNYSKFLNRLGYLPGEIALPEALTGSEFIDMMQGLRRVKDDKRTKYLLDMFELDPSGHTKRMSLGVKRKLAIVAAFMNEPETLILDEPTSGLDPIMQERFVQLIKEEKKRGATILLSSHIFSEVDATCDRISVIKEGRIASTFVADELKHNKNKNYKIEFLSPEGYSEFVRTGFDITSKDDSSLKAKVNINDENIGELIAFIARYPVKYFSEIKFSLEDYFIQFYENQKTFGGVGK